METERKIIEQVARNFNVEYVLNALLYHNPEAFWKAHSERNAETDSMMSNQHFENEIIKNIIQSTQESFYTNLSNSDKVKHAVKEYLSGLNETDPEYIERVFAGVLAFIHCQINYEPYCPVMGVEIVQEEKKWWEFWK